MGFIQQASNFTVLSVFLFGVDLKSLPYVMPMIFVGVPLFYITVGYFYKRIGLQHLEDYINADMNPVTKEMLLHLRNSSQVGGSPPKEGGSTHLRRK